MLELSRLQHDKTKIGIVCNRRPTIWNSNGIGWPRQIKKCVKTSGGDQWLWQDNPSGSETVTEQSLAGRLIPAKYSHRISNVNVKWFEWIPISKGNTTFGNGSKPIHSTGFASARHRQPKLSARRRRSSICGSRHEAGWRIPCIA